jgi:hypothetical protein
MKLHPLLLVVAATAGLGAAPVTHAASTWTFNGVSNGVSTTTSGNVGVTASGVYAANGGSFVNNGSTYGINGFASGATWTVNNASPYSSGSSLQYYGPSGGANDGLGMASDGSVAPDHAIDNGPAYNSSGVATGLGNTEAVLLSFGSSVVLSSITTGYVSGDSDFSVFEYTGASPPVLSGASVNQTTATSTGWVLVGNYDGTGGGIGPGVSGTGGTTAVNSGGVSSSWWLISAYNNSYGPNCANCNVTGGSVLQGNDYFKLYQVAATVGAGSNVPEPGSMALVALGLLGAYAARRKAMSTASSRPFLRPMSAS